MNKDEKVKRVLLNLVASYISRAEGKSSRAGFYTCIEEAERYAKMVGDEDIVRELRRTEFHYKIPLKRVKMILRERYGIDVNQYSGNMPEIEFYEGELRDLIE